MPSDPEIPLSLSAAPELVFGLVAPIGVDLDLITEPLEQSLAEMEYDAHRFRLTELMREVPTGLPLDDSHYIESFKQRIAYANEVRRQLGDEALAALAVSAIRAFRAGEWARRRQPQPNIAGHTGAVLDDSDEETSIPNQVYIIRQIKRPEEVRLLRGVYGRQFILVAAYVPQELRGRVPPGGVGAVGKQPAAATATSQAAAGCLSTAVVIVNRR